MPFRAEWRTIVARHAWPPAGLPMDLSPGCLAFLEAWRSYASDPLFREITALDPLWDRVPLIVSSGRTRMCEYGRELEGILQFVTFWRSDGELTHPAVDAEMADLPGPRVRQWGQSVGDAYLRKPAQWITILTVAGFFHPIELLNIVSGPPPRLACSEPTTRAQGSPIACLETFLIVKAPQRVSFWQRSARSWCRLRRPGRAR